MACLKIEERIPTRFIIAGMRGLSCMFLSIIRSIISILILAITKNVYDPSIEMLDYGPRHEWSTYEQSLVIGTFFCGNTIISSCAGVFAERYGARRKLGYSFGITALLSSLSPIVAQSLWSIILIRFLTGLMMGAVFPSLHAIVANWARPDEEDIFLSLDNITSMGAVIGWSMSGHIIEQFLLFLFSHTFWIYKYLNDVLAEVYKRAKL